jgi:hypothetical protein
MEHLVANVIDAVIGDYLILDRKQLKLSVLQVRIRSCGTIYV